MANYSLKLSKADSTGQCQVIVRLTIDRDNRPSFKSGVFVQPEWLKDGEIVVPKKGKLNIPEVRMAEQAKSNLSTFTSKLARITNELNGHGEITRQTIEEALKLTERTPIGEITYQGIREQKEAKEREEKMKENKKTFFELLDLYSHRDISEGRRRGFMVLVRIIKRYELFVRMADNERKDFILDIEKIDKDTVEDFFSYLANEKSIAEENPTIFQRILKNVPVEISPKHGNRKIVERGRNLLVERRKQFKAFYTWYVKEKYTTDNQPFYNVDMGKGEYGTPYFLTLEERNIIADWDLSNNKRLEEQRDIFIFQSLTGCRVGDLLKFRQDNIVTKEGIVVLTYIPRKTIGTQPKTVEVPLNERAISLVNKYKGVNDNKLFPFIASQNYNNAIKEVLTVCGITRKVTVMDPITGEQEQKPLNEIASSHMARRTFVGNLYLKVKDPNLIGRMSGHSENSRAFNRYRDIDLKTLKETIINID